MFDLLIRPNFPARHTGVLLICCALLTQSSHGQLVARSVSDQTDMRFLRQLLDRGFFDLAERYCSERIASRSSVEERAFWVDQLSDACRRHAEAAGESDRRALTNQSVEVITDFLSANVVAPETDLALRLNQMKVLRDIARTDLLLRFVGYRGPGKKDSYWPGGEHSEAERVLELAEAMSRQMQTHRRELDSDRIDWLMEETRLLKVESLCLISLTTNPGDPQFDVRYEQARREVLQLRRTAREPATTKAAVRLLVELQLSVDDFEGLQISLGQLADDSLSSERLMLVIRSHLRQGKATEAYALCEQSLRSPDTAHPEVELLRLESLLLLRLFGDQLHDADMIRQADSSFEHASQLARARTPSIYRDACLKVIARYELIRTVGADVADLVDRLEHLRSIGDHSAALQMTERAIRQLPPDVLPQSRAALQLRQGELLIALKRWDDALEPLELAETGYASTGHANAASAAGLLHTFAIGQRWKSEPDDAEKQDAWIEALIQHRRQWSGETSTDQSTQWLLQIAQEIDPLLAADVLADTVLNAETPEERLTQLELLGRQMNQLADPAAPPPMHPTRSGRQLKELVNLFLADVDQLALDDVDRLTTQQGRLWLHHSRLLANAETPFSLWDKLRQRLDRIEQDLDKSNEALSESERFRMLLLRFVIQARTSRGTGDLDALRSAIFGLPKESYFQSAKYLASFLREGGPIQAGDLAISLSVERFIGLHLSDEIGSGDLVTMLALVSRAGLATGHSRPRIDVLNRLPQSELTVDQLLEISQILMSSGNRNAPELMECELEFWKRLRMGSEEGSEIWLESTLQCATTEARQGDVEQALQRLTVTSAIYPLWGSAQRQTRATALLQSLPSGEPQEP